MKKRLQVFLLLSLISTNLFAVYHKVSDIIYDEWGMDQQLVGNNLYIIDNNNFLIYDVCNVEFPTLLFEQNYESYLRKLLVSDNYAFIGGSDGIDIYLIEDLSQVNLITHLDEPSVTTGLAINNDFLFAISPSNGLYVYDISDIAFPELIDNGTVDLNKPEDIEIANNAAFIRTYEAGIDILNIEDPNQIEISGHLSHFYFIIHENRLYTSEYPEILFEYDISNPFEPVLLNTFPDMGTPKIYKNNHLITISYGEISVYEHNAGFQKIGEYGAEGWSDNIQINENYIFDQIRQAGIIHIIDYSDPSYDKEIFSINNNELRRITDIEVRDSYAYLGLNYPLKGKIIDFSDFDDIQIFPISNNRANKIELYEQCLFTTYSYLRWFDISDPVNPVQIDSLWEHSIDITIKNNKLFSKTYRYLNIFDISNLPQVTLLDTIPITSTCSSLIVENGLAFFSASPSYVIICDVSDPQSSDVIATYYANSYCFGLTYNNGILYASTENDGLLVLDVSDPYFPNLITTIKPHPSSSFYAPAQIQNNKIIIADTNWNEFSIYDITNPENITLLNSYRSYACIHDMQLVDDILYTGNFATGFTAYDFSELGSKSEEINIPNIKLQNYPNPFDAETTISFNLTAEDGEIAEVIIYNIKGQKVKTLECGNYFDAKATDTLYHTTWDGKDENNKPVSSGIYFYQIKAGKFSANKKMILMH